MKRTTTVAIAVLVLAGLCALLLASRKGTAVQAPAAPAVAVDAVRPARVDMARFVEVYGTLSPKNAAEVKSEIPARVHRIQVKEWDSVREKDLLLELDATDAKLNVSKQEAGVKMARAQLVQAQVDLSRTKREWQRAGKLKEGGLVTGQELDERKTAQESAEARVVLCRAQVAQAESQVAEARSALDKTVICAPIQGAVHQRKVDAGDWVDKGALLFSIVDNRVFDFTANVAAVDLYQIREGQLVTFTVDGLPDRAFSGRIKRINPMVAASDRTGRIQAEVENGDGVLKGGVFARGRIAIEERPGVLALPKTAFSSRDINKNSARVFVIQEGEVAKVREVATGIEDQNMVEIRSGLDHGERVVNRGGFNLRDGDRVSETVSGSAAAGS
ncbi:MAG: efflux RND transporter periplasmic adaptor subunit [Syntrophobacteraceae bacterium]